MDESISNLIICARKLGVSDSAIIDALLKSESKFIVKPKEEYINIKIKNSKFINWEERFKEAAVYVKEGHSITKSLIMTGTSSCELKKFKLWLNKNNIKYNHFPYMKRSKSIVEQTYTEDHQNVA